MDFSKVVNQNGNREIEAEINEADFKPLAKQADPFDLERAKKSFSVYHDIIKKWMKAVKQLEVKNEDTEKEMNERIAQAASLAKKIKKTQEDITADAYGFYKAVLNFSKPFRDDLDDIVKTGKRKLGEYGLQKELKRREAEKKAQEEAKKLQAKMEEDAKKAGVEAPIVTIPVLPQKPEATRTESGSTHFGTEWTFELEDISKVPIEYLLLNEWKVDAAIDAGIREIAGLRIFEKGKITLRTS